MDRQISFLAVGRIFFFIITFFFFFYIKKIIFILKVLMNPG